MKLKKDCLTSSLFYYITQHFTCYNIYNLKNDSESPVGRGFCFHHVAHVFQLSKQKEFFGDSIPVQNDRPKGFISLISTFFKRKQG
jgi:hypothetical protein